MRDSATAAFRWNGHGRDAHDQQRVDPFADGIGTVHVVKLANFQPDEFRMRNIECASVRKVNGEREKRLPGESFPDFTDHGVMRCPPLFACAAFSRAARCFHQFDDHRRIDAFRIPQFISVEEHVEAWSRMHFTPTLYHQFAPILESDNERLEWLLNLAVEDFLEHGWTVGTVRKAGKRFF